MIRANIQDADNAHIGTINEEAGGFRIWWRGHADDHAGTIHSAEKVLYPSLKEARQGVFRARQDAKITET